MNKKFSRQGFPIEWNLNPKCQIAMRPRGPKLVGMVVLVVTFVMAGVVVEAQQPQKMARLAYLGVGSPTVNSGRREALLHGLRDYGYLEGKNLIIDYRWAEGKAELLQEQAAQLVSLKPDVIFTGAPQGTLTAKKATVTIPIVFVGIGDPVGIGVVASLASPGGNITGIANMSPELSGKRLELLKESAPKITSVAVLWNPSSQGHQQILKEIEAVAPGLKLKLYPLAVRKAEDFDGAFQAAAKSRADALLPLGDPLIGSQSKRVIDYAERNRLPAVYANSESADAGGLMSYATNIADQYRRAAVYVDKILKGTKPADLPVEQPMKIEFVINLKTAKQIGLTIPPNVLARADRVIR
jgi:putative ABC transport system substrate-binding protein